MAKVDKPGEHIERLRKSLGMTQERFSNQFSVTQSRISEWEGEGPTEPSVEAWMKMAALAISANPANPAEAVYFWKQTEIDSRFLISLAEAMLQTGEADARRILPISETILKARLSDRESLVSQGKAVLVPPYTEGEWKHQASLSPVLVSGDAITNIASTYYLYVEPEGDGPWGQGFAPKDKIIFDSSEAISRRIEPFRNRNVVLNFTESWMPPVAMPHRPRGVYIGRLAVAKDGARLWLTLGAHDHHPILHGPGPLPLSVVTLLPLIPSGHREQVQRGTRYAEYPNVIDLTEEEVISELTIPNGCEIMGRFLGLIDGGSTGGYETTDRTLRLIRGQSR